MGDDNAAKEEVKSVIDEFELSELLPKGIVFEIKQIEARQVGAMTEGDVSSIYSQLQQGLRMEKSPTPEGFTFSAVRKHYDL